MNLLTNGRDSPFGPQQAENVVTELRRHVIAANVSDMCALISAEVRGREGKIPAVVHCAAACWLHQPWPRGILHSFFEIWPS